MTAYRQQALACAALLVDGSRRTSELKPTVPDAPKILLHNVYGWFVREERGRYALTPLGKLALARWPQPTCSSAPTGDGPWLGVEESAAGAGPGAQSI
jgi:hypothetical protein